MLLHELKTVQLQECFTLMTLESIGHLKTLCMSVLLLSSGVESEWKCYSLVLKKMLVFYFTCIFLSCLLCYLSMVFIVFVKASNSNKNKLLQNKSTNGKKYSK